MKECRNKDCRSYKMQYSQFNYCSDCGSTMRECEPHYNCCGEGKQSPLKDKFCPYCGKEANYDV